MKSLKTKFKFSLPHAFTLLLGILVLVGIISLILAYAKVEYKDTVLVTKNFNVVLSKNHSSEAELENQFQKKINNKKIKTETLFYNQIGKKKIITQFDKLTKLKEAIVNFVELSNQKIFKLNQKVQATNSPTLIAKYNALSTKTIFTNLDSLNGLITEDAPLSYAKAKASVFFNLKAINKKYDDLLKIKKNLKVFNKTNVNAFLNQIDQQLKAFADINYLFTFLTYGKFASLSLNSKEQSLEATDNFIWKIAVLDASTQEVNFSASNSSQFSFVKMFKTFSADEVVWTFTLKQPEFLEKKILGAGILDWMTAVPVGVFEAFWIIIALFVLGAYINVVVKTKALDALIGKISNKFAKNYKEIKYQDFIIQNKNRFISSSLWTQIRYRLAILKEEFRQTWVIIPLMLFFHFGGTSYGMAEETLAFYAIIVPLALAAGFDVFTGFLIVFVGAGAGVMGSTINPYSVLSAVEATKKTDADIAITVSDGAAWRWLGWAIFCIFTTLFVMWYAARVKKDKKQSYLKDLFAVHEKAFQQAKTGSEAPVLTKRRLVIVFIFLFSFVLMVLALLNYDSMDAIAYSPEKAKETGFKGPFAKFNEENFGNQDSTVWFHNTAVNSQLITENFDQSDYVTYVFGNWYLGTLAAYFFIASLLIAFINRHSQKEYIDDMLTGIKDMITVVFAVGIARSISVLLRATNMQDYFVIELSKAIENSQGNKNITIPLFSYVIFSLLTFVIPSTSGLANAAFPILGKSVHNVDPNLLSGTITGYAWGAGWANLFVPTYGVVIGALALTKIPYEKFLKAIWKYLLFMFLLGFLLIILGGWTGSQVF